MNRQQKRAAKFKGQPPKHSSLAVPVLQPAELFDQALAHHQNGRLEQAEALYRQILAVDESHVDSLHLLGVVAYQSGRLQLAEEMIRQAIGRHADIAAFHSNLGNVLKDQGRLTEALQCYEQAIALQPDYVDALFNLANVLRDQGQAALSLQRYQQVLRLRPDYAEAYLDAGVAWAALERMEEAANCYRQALVLRPEFPEALCNLGSALQSLGRLQEAFPCYQRAITLRPKFPQAIFNLGNAHKDAGNLHEAIMCYEQALSQRLEFPEAWFNLGNVLKDIGQLDDAISCYEKALVLKPDFKDVFHNLLYVLNYHADKSAEEIFAVYREYDRRFALPFRKDWQGHRNPSADGRRLKIGYVSPDFRLHSIRHFLEPLLMHHDRQRIEIFAYAELEHEDAVTARYKSHLEHWIPTAGMTDAALEECIRKDGIDILVDLAGHTSGNRLQLFARKPAPVSVTWLVGYGYSTGLSAIDYILTDAVTVPAGSEKVFSEKPWRLESPGFTYRPAENMGVVSSLPAKERGYITFATLTRSIRINHRVIALWSEILRQIDNARLVIDSKLFENERLRSELERKFLVHGITPDRLQIGFHSPPWDVLRGVDITLDCFPHNSGTTLFESLYMGVPYVTLSGRPGVGCIGGAILHGVGHPEWVACSETEYLEKVLALASDWNSLERLRNSLRGQMEASPLMDEEGFARAVEAAYCEMFKQWHLSGAQEI